jgi:uncharacterized protein
MSGTEAVITKILSSYRTFAIVGCSPEPSRESHRVARYLQANGYRIIPVHPAGGTILGERCYPDLRSIPDRVEVVDLFRRSELVAPHVAEAIAVGARAIWMQLEVIDEAAAAQARAAGLDVVMDRCPAIEHSRLAAAGFLP